MSSARRFPSLFAAAMVLWIARSAAAAPADFMFRATIDGETIEGQPLAWTADNMHLLGRDGRLYEFDPRDAKDAEKTAPRFEPFSMPELKRELYREFGDDLEITTTNHYIVAHPRGGHSDWAARFEELYRWCVGYFRVRGFRPREPEFPLVAIVYRNEAEYYQAAAARGTPLPSGMLGHYDDSNRVYLYDVTAGKTDGDWSENADTIIHEATHQTAFNVGIHNRFADQPRWLVEGLATMFEARGVWNSQSFHSLKDRLNQGRLRSFRAGLARRQPGTMVQLIASDQFFFRNLGAGYAEAWALTLFLCETRPREYVKFLEKVAARPDFSNYSTLARVTDFAECFGSDFKQLEANFLNWMKEIPAL